jgi:hypothetical protein
MEANPYRGEVLVELSGVSYAARPDYHAILSWEEETGRATTELLMRLSAGIITLREIVAVLRHAIASGGRPVSAEFLGTAIVQHGQTEVYRPLGTVLKNALTGGKEAEPGEPAAAEARAGSPIAA